MKKSTQPKLRYSYVLLALFYFCSKSEGFRNDKQGTFAASKDSESSFDLAEHRHTRLYSIDRTNEILTISKTPTNKEGNVNRHRSNRLRETDGITHADERIENRKENFHQQMRRQTESDERTVSVLRTERGNERRTDSFRLGENVRQNLRDRKDQKIDESRNNIGTRKGEINEKDRDTLRTMHENHGETSLREHFNRRFSKNGGRIDTETIRVNRERVERTRENREFDKKQTERGVRDFQGNRERRIKDEQRENTKDTQLNNLEVNTDSRERRTLSMQNRDNNSLKVIRTFEGNTERINYRENKMTRNLSRDQGNHVQDRIRKRGTSSTNKPLEMLEKELTDDRHRENQRLARFYRENRDKRTTENQNTQNTMVEVIENRGVRDVNIRNRVEGDKVREREDPDRRRTREATNVRHQVRREDNNLHGSRFHERNDRREYNVNINIEDARKIETNRNENFNRGRQLKLRENRDQRTREVNRKENVRPNYNEDLKSEENSNKISKEQRNAISNRSEERGQIRSNEITRKFEENESYDRNRFRERDNRVEFRQIGIRENRRKFATNFIRDNLNEALTDLFSEKREILTENNRNSLNTMLETRKEDGVVRNIQIERDETCQKSRENIANEKRKNLQRINNNNRIRENRNTRSNRMRENRWEIREMRENSEMNRKSRIEINARKLEQTHRVRENLHETRDMESRKTEVRENSERNRESRNEINDRKVEARSNRMRTNRQETQNREKESHNEINARKLQDRSSRMRERRLDIGDFESRKTEVREEIPGKINTLNRLQENRNENVPPAVRSETDRREHLQRSQRTYENKIRETREHSDTEMQENRIRINRVENLSKINRNEIRGNRGNLERSQEIYNNRALENRRDLRVNSERINNRIRENGDEIMLKFGESNIQEIRTDDNRDLRKAVGNRIRNSERIREVREENPLQLNKNNRRNIVSGVTNRHAERTYSERVRENRREIRKYSTTEESRNTERFNNNIRENRRKFDLQRDNRIMRENQEDTNSNRGRVSHNRMLERNRENFRESRKQTANDLSVERILTENADRNRSVRDDVSYGKETKFTRNKEESREEMDNNQCNRLHTNNRNVSPNQITNNRNRVDNNKIRQTRDELLDKPIRNNDNLYDGINRHTGSIKRDNNNRIRENRREFNTNGRNIETERSNKKTERNMIHENRQEIRKSTEVLKNQVQFRSRRESITNGFSTNVERNQMNSKSVIRREHLAVERNQENRRQTLVQRNLARINENGLNKISYLYNDVSKILGENQNRIDLKLLSSENRIVNPRKKRASEYNTGTRKQENKTRVNVDESNQENRQKHMMGVLTLGRLYSDLSTDVTRTLLINKMTENMDKSESCYSTMLESVVLAFLLYQLTTLSTNVKRFQRLQNITWLPAMRVF